MHQRPSHAALAILALLTLSGAGCSSFTSRVLDPALPAAGIVYHLPKKDVLATVTVASGKPTAISFATTSAYPDRTVAFLLEHSVNGFAKNVTTFEVRNGLLTSSNGTLTSQVSDALKNLAGASATLGTRRTLAEGDAKPVSACGADGNHTFLIDPKSTEPVCGDLKVTITELSSPTPVPSTRQPSLADPQQPGVYYRQLKGVLAVAKGMGLDTATILYLPAEQPQFLPTGRSFFANNAAEITLDDGVLTKFKRDADGEVVALLKLPADIFAAYFAAVGGVFDAFRTRDSKEIAALQESLKVESIRQKYTLCLAAVRTADDELVTKLGCDKP